MNVLIFQLYLQHYWNQLSFYSVKRMTNFNGRKQLICLCFQHNVRGQARQEIPKTIPRTNPEQLNQEPKGKAPYLCHYILNGQTIWLRESCEAMKALWLLSEKRIWIMLFSTQVCQVISWFPLINISHMLTLLSKHNVTTWSYSTQSYTYYNRIKMLMH